MTSRTKKTPQTGEFSDVPRETLDRIVLLLVNLQSVVEVRKACREKLGLTGEQADLGIEHAKKAIIRAAEIYRGKTSAVQQARRYLDGSINCQDLDGEPAEWATALLDLGKIINDMCYHLGLRFWYLNDFRFSAVKRASLTVKKLLRDAQKRRNEVFQYLQPGHRLGLETYLVLGRPSPMDTVFEPTFEPTHELSQHARIDCECAGLDFWIRLSLSISTFITPG